MYRKLLIKENTPLHILLNYQNISGRNAESLQNILKKSYKEETKFVSPNSLKHSNN